MDKNILIVIPVFNEADNIEEVIKGIQPFAEVLIINDCSTDNTEKIILKLKQEFPNLHYIKNDSNLHITKTISKGIKFALEKDQYQFILTMDAGLSHQSLDVQKIIKEKEYDLVLSKRSNKDNCPISRRIISLMAALAFSFVQLFKKRRFVFIEDATSGLRMYSTNLLKNINTDQLYSQSFGFHFELLYRVFSKNISVKKVNINYLFTNSSFNLGSLKDALQTLKCIILN